MTAGAVSKCARCGGRAPVRFSGRVVHLEGDELMMHVEVCDACIEWANRSQSAAAESLRIYVALARGTS